MSSSYSLTYSHIIMAHNAKTWKFMCVVRDMILENDGMIFGGFVRDSIRHDHFATQFYEGCAAGNVLYNNPHFMPEAIDRMRVPKDIDCRMTETMYENLLHTFERKKISFNLLFIRDPHSYMTNIDINDSTLKHLRLRVTINMTRVKRALNELPIGFHEIKSPIIMMDILTTRSGFDQPFVSKPDFECNALYMTRHGISLSEHVCPKRDFYRHELMRQQVISDIIGKKTKYLNPDPDSELSTSILCDRVSSMLIGGWIVEDDIVQTVNDEKYDGHCIICHDKVQKIHFKLPCCDGRYHGKCLQQALTVGQQAMRLTNTCIMCKEHVQTSETNLPYIVSKFPFCNSLPETI